MNYVNEKRNGDGDRVSQTVDGVTTTYILDTATPLTMVLVETTGEDSVLYMNDGMRIIGQRRRVQFHENNSVMTAQTNSIPSP